jgi:hypothetical protein
MRLPFSVTIEIGILSGLLRPDAIHLHQSYQRNGDIVRLYFSGPAM